MRRIVEITVPRKIDKLTPLLRIKGVPVYFHWSVLLIALLALYIGGRNPFGAFLGLAVYVAILLIHETGHLIACHRMRCRVDSIRLYPIFGVTEFEEPWSRFDHCVIAWGGVLAQAIIAVPVLLWICYSGYTRFQWINTVLTIGGSLNLTMAAFNLLPMPGLDGEIAWFIIPEGIRRLRQTRTRRPPTWRR